MWCGPGMLGPNWRHDYIGTIEEYSNASHSTIYDCYEGDGGRSDSIPWFGCWAIGEDRHQLNGNIYQICY